MDIEHMAEELGLEAHEVRRLVLTFLESTDQDLILLRRAFSEGDAETIERLIYGRKSIRQFKPEPVPTHHGPSPPSIRFIVP